MAVTINGTTGIAGVDGSASTPAVQGTDTNTGIFFPAADTIAFGEGGAEVMRIDSSGNVGIGTTSPSKKLDIVANSDAIGASVRGRSSDNVGLYNFTSNDGVTQYGYILGSSAELRVAQNGANYITAYTNGAERARITSDGNLLVGTTSLTAGNSKLTVKADGSGNSGISANSAGTSAYNIISIENGNGQVGRIQTNGSATSYLTSSDYRLKEAIAPMTGALEKVVALKPCTYKWKVDGADGEGFIAHELAEIVPACVGGEKDAVDADGNPKYQGIDTSFLVATLTAAIQELKAELDTTKARLAALEAK